MFEPRLHDDHFDIHPFPLDLLAQHPEAEVVNHPLGSAWRFDGKDVMFTGNRVRVDEGGETFELTVAESPLMVNRSGDWVRAAMPQQAALTSSTDGTTLREVLLLLDGTEITDVTEDVYLYRTKVTPSGVTEFPVRLAYGPYEVSDEKVFMHGDVVAEKQSNGRWLWMLSTVEWLAARADLRRTFRNFEFHDDVPLIPEEMR